MEQDLITIEGAAFKAIMNKIDRIEKFVLEVQEENKKKKAGPARLLAGKEAAAILRVSKQTLWRMRDRGGYTIYKAGKYLPVRTGRTGKRIGYQSDQAKEEPAGQRAV